jgi:hypothetical protein
MLVSVILHFPKPVASHSQRAFFVGQRPDFAPEPFVLPCRGSAFFVQTAQDRQYMLLTPLILNLIFKQRLKRRHAKYPT